MQLKKEQEERARKRIEEKVMRNQLLLKQTENKLRKQEELAMALKLNEKLRQDQIRSRGWDRLDLSKQELVTIPLEMYATESAKARLSYAVIVDLSKNVLESLPPSDFLYWMTSVRHLNMSTNRLTTLPDEMKLLTNIEVLEGYNNRLISLPPEIGGISALLRLDLGSNFLTSIPNSIGKCTSLKYLSLHSNKLTYLPTAIGACMRLEYIVCTVTSTALVYYLVIVILS
jgi:Leucine-rich repeat (LRR) protein